MSAHYDRYDGWASLYNATMGPEYGHAQFEIVERLILPSIPARATILDLCCGTGQLLTPLAEAGYAVTGLDGSTEMLRFAAENAPDAKLVAEDAREFRNPEAFDAVVSTSASLNHVGSLDDLQCVFGNVFASLRPGGGFLFDLNHPAQLERWWNGRPTEGEIDRHLAWMITPEYDAARSEGRFTVTVYSAPEASIRPWKTPLYRLLSLPRFIGLRLCAIGRFDRLEPEWARDSMAFPVFGHSIDGVRERLERVGFDDICVETADGMPLDENHSAHFVCRKPSEDAS